MIEPLGIYEAQKWSVKFRLIPTGNKDGLLYEFYDCTDLKRAPLHFYEKEVKLKYNGNITAPSIDDNKPLDLGRY